MTSAGAPPQLAPPILSRVPVTGALFSAFLGYNPVQSILSTLPPVLTSSLSPPSVVAYLTSKTWFPTVIAPPFMTSLRISFYIGAALSAAAALASALRGGEKYIHEAQEAALRSRDPQ